MSILNIKAAGLGGQGVLKVTDIIADAAFISGKDIKKSEVHGMSQRGGSVSSDVRIAVDGGSVASPMIPNGETDILIILDMSQKDLYKDFLRPGCKVITPEDLKTPPENPKALNIALLGAAAPVIGFSDDIWHKAICMELPEHLQEMNIRVFDLARSESSF